MRLVEAAALELENRLSEELSRRLESVAIVVLDGGVVGGLADEASVEVELVVVGSESDVKSVVEELYIDTLESTLTLLLGESSAEVVVESDVASELELEMSEEVVGSVDEVLDGMSLTDVSPVVDEEMSEPDIAAELDGVEVTELDASELSPDMLADKMGDVEICVVSVVLSSVLGVSVVLEDDSDSAIELVETDDGVSEVLADDSDVSTIELVRLLDGTPSLVVDKTDVREDDVWSL